MLNKNNDFLVQVVKGEAVLLNAKTGDYFGLNEVGNEFYQLVDGEKSFDEIVDLLDQEYQVERNTLKQDLEELVGLLIKRQILFEED